MNPITMEQCQGGDCGRRSVIVDKKSSTAKPLVGAEVALPECGGYESIRKKHISASSPSLRILPQGLLKYSELTSICKLSTR